MKFVRESLILLFVILSYTANAKSITKAEKRADVITEWMEKKLDLNSDQISKIKVLNLECEKEIDRLTIEKAGFSCMQAVRDSVLQKESAFRKILSSKQLLRYKKNKLELKELLRKFFKG